MAIIPSSNWALEETITQTKANQPYYIETVTSNPTSPKDGDMVYNSTDDIIYVYDNAAWKPLGISGQVAIHGNERHTYNYYYQESDLTAVLNDNYYPSSLGHNHVADSTNPHNTSVYNLTDTIISTPQSGQLLTYNGVKWVNYPPPSTFSIANVKISANQNINLARFVTPAGKKVYAWMAQAADSSNQSVNDLKIQLLSGSTVVYSTSSNTVQIGYPLAETLGNIEIRFAYSGANVTGIQYGTAFMNISIY